MNFSVKLLGFSWNLGCLFWMLYISNNKVYNNENIFFFLFFKIYIFHSHWKKWISFLIWISIPFTVLIFIKINTIWVLNLSFSHPDSLQQYWSNVSFLFWPFYVYCMQKGMKKTYGQRLQSTWMVNLWWCWEQQISGSTVWSWRTVYGSLLVCVISSYQNHNTHSSIGSSFMLLLLVMSRVLNFLHISVMLWFL